MIDETPDMFIHSVSFRPDDMLEIIYLEARNQTDYAGSSTSVVMDMAHIVDEVDELQENLRDLVDRIWELIRHPEEVDKRPPRTGEVTPPPELGQTEDDEDE